MMKKIIWSVSLIMVNLITIAQTNLFPANGNVGIGTDIPSVLLDVYNSNHSNSILRISGTYETPGSYAAVILGAGTIKGRGKGGVFFEPYGTTYGLGKMHFVVNNSASEAEATLADAKMTILAAGNVGIGTVLPTEKLSVNGNIRAKEVKVEVSNWPDYVFKEGYNLMSLAETARFIDKYGHLPEMPSMEEVENEGVELGMMNKLLLKKIEELTLHLLEKDKVITAEKNLNSNQQMKIEELNNNYKDLKALVNKMIEKTPKK